MASQTTTEGPITDRAFLEDLTSVLDLQGRAILSQCNQTTAHAAMARLAKLRVRIDPPVVAPGTASPAPAVVPIETRDAIAELAAVTETLIDALGTTVRNTPFLTAMRRVKALRDRLTASRAAAA